MSNVFGYLSYPTLFAIFLANSLLCRENHVFRRSLKIDIV